MRTPFVTTLCTLAVAAALVLTGCDSGAEGQEGTPADAGIPDLSLSDRALDLSNPAPPTAIPGAGDPIPGHYVVVLREEPATASLVDDLAAVQAEVASLAGGEVSLSFRHTITGFAAQMSAAQAADLANDPRVAYVEPDRRVVAVATQSNAPWGLDRIDQRSGTDNTYSYTADGTGVTAYIIDTGIRTDHADFGGRASNGFDAFGGNGQDCNGHGTHVAGTVGGSTYGAAKNVTLVGVRVLNCSGSGSTSGVIAGIDYVAQNASGPSVANMSLGGGASSSLDAAIRNAVGQGVTVVVAAGNENQNACNVSPAREAQAITVGATSSNDARASFSNYGSCVDLFAPGVSIRSTWYTSSTSTASLSGTSMASPHVAGAAALYLDDNGGASPAQVAQAIADASTKGIVTSSNTANNDLLYTTFGSGGGDPPPPPPPPPPVTIELEASSRYWWRYAIVDLTWSGATSSQVDVYVNGSLGATTANDGRQSYNLGWRTRGSFTFKICEAGTQTCSNESTATY